MMDAAETINSTLSMADVARQYGFEPNRGGYIACPFHAEHTPSLKIYDTPGRGWHCYGCGAGGSVIDFVMQLFNIPFTAALVRLSADFGLNICNDRPDPREVLRIKSAALAARRAEEARQADCDDRVERFRGLWLRLKAMCPDDPSRPGLMRTIDAAEQYLQEHPYTKR